jgi:hypothetical protein
LITNILNRLCQLAAPLMSPPQAVVQEIDYNKVLRIFGVLDASHVAPFNIAAPFSQVIGTVKVRPSKTNFANRILLNFGSGQKAIIDALGTGSGVQTTWTPNYILVSHENYVNVGGSVVGGVITGGVNEILGDIGSGATWILDGTAGTVTRSSPPVGALHMPYTAGFPDLVVADGSSNPSEAVERLFYEENVFDVVLAQAIVNSLLEQLNVLYKDVSYPTTITGLHPGQTQGIVFPKYNVSGNHLITGVHIHDRLETLWQYEVTAIAGTAALPESFMETYKLWGSSAGSSAGTISVITNSTIRQSFFLGGSEILYRQSPTTPGWIAADAVQVPIDTAVRGSITGVVYARVRATSGSVTARLYNVTDNMVAGTGTLKTSTSWEADSFVVALMPGNKLYELQMLPSLADTDVAATGTFV